LRFRLHHGELLEASITVPGYIDGCQLPFYPFFPFHTQPTTSLNLQTLKHQEPPLDPLNPLYHSTTIHHPKTNFFSQCLPWSNSLLALALPQTGLSLLFPSEPSTTLDDSEQLHLYTDISREEPTCLHARRAHQAIHSSAALFLHLHQFDCILEAGTFEHLFSLDPHLFNSKHDPQHAWLHPHRQRKSAARYCTCLCLPSSASTLAPSMQIEDHIYRSSHASMHCTSVDSSACTPSSRLLIDDLIFLTRFNGVSIIYLVVGLAHHS
jgi:hypothetical protein